MDPSGSRPTVTVTATSSGSRPAVTTPAASASPTTVAAPTGGSAPAARLGKTSSVNWGVEGECVWYVLDRFQKKSGVYPLGYDDAWNFANSTGRNGWSVGSTPRVDSVVVFQPGDNGAGTIEVRGSDPRQAARIADTVAERLSIAVGELLPSSGGNPQPGMAGSVPVRLTVAAPAAVASRPEGPQVGLNVALGLAVGLSVGVALALLRDVMSGRVDHRGRGRLAQAPVIATMARARGARVGASRQTAFGRIIRLRTPDGRGPAGESGDEVLQLRAGFEHLRAKHGLRTVVFSSAFDDEATGAVVFELAHVLARAGIRVLLVDADLRRPDLDRRCGRRATVGLTSVAQGLMPWSGVVVQLGWELPDLLPAGLPADDPGAVLGNGLLTGALREAAKRYDVVLVRAPAAPRVADGLLLVADAGGTVLVVERRSSSREALREQIDSLRLVSAQVVGVVLV